MIFNPSKNQGVLIFLLALSFTVRDATGQTSPSAEPDATNIDTTALAKLEALRDELKVNRKSKAKQINSIDHKLDSLRNEIEILSGWLTGFDGLLGFDFSQSHRWMSNNNPNSSSSSLSLNLGSFANRVKDRSFWRNSVLINLAWQSLDPDTKDHVKSTFLNRRTTDVLQLSSLYGYRLNDDLATSTMGDLNTSVFNFLKPGSLGFGLGATWTPGAVKNFVAVVNPLTLQFIFTDRDEVKNTSTLGMKLKIAYQKNFEFGLGWSSSLTGFAPYQGPEEGQPNLFEYTWINAVSFNLWKGLGVGFNIGIRKADFEVEELQAYQTLGISFVF